MKDRFTRATWNRDSKEVRDFCRAKVGRLSELHRRLNKHTKKKWQYKNLSLWFNEDEARRAQPLYGVGKLILELGAELMKEKNGDP